MANLRAKEAIDVHVGPRSFERAGTPVLMRAVVVQRQSEPRLVLQDVPDSLAGEDECLVEVSFIGVNPGEIKDLSIYENNSRIGWDFAGTVLKPAGNGAGPQAGKRVVGTTRSGGWAENVASPIDMVAEVPEGLELELAVCLPVPAMTAYVALRYAGLLFGKRVLVTGAAGAVGQFACQIALASGARVSAAVRRDDQKQLVTSHGIEDVRVTDGIAAFRDGGSFYDLILDVVGPGVGEDAAALLDTGGVHAVVSAAGGEVLPLPILPMLSAAGQLRVVNLFADIARGPDTGGEILSRLLASAALGEITVPLGPIEAWESIDEIVRAYLVNPHRAKPVLVVGKRQQCKDFDA